METQIWQPLGLALGLGLLVGLERERAKASAGIRTFPLITLLGAICGRLASTDGGWILAGGLLAVAAVLTVQLVRRPGPEPIHHGPTTEIAALVMYGAGAMLAVGLTAPAIAVAGSMAILLQWKRPLHTFVERIGEHEIRAVFRLVLVAMVVLPVLPDRSFGPYGVLNPFRVWLMVVLIVGISLVGYLASHYIGARVGAVVAGALGGLISSTATTVGVARRSIDEPAETSLASVTIVIASAVVFMRVLGEVAVVAPSVLPDVLPQLGLMTGLMGAIAADRYRRASRPAARTTPPEEHPAGLSAAVLFGALYALVLLAAAAVQARFGDSGLYVVAFVSGLTDMDAITLATIQLIEAGMVATDTGWRMMVVGALSNIIFKGLVVATLGSPGLARQIAASFGLALAGGVLLLATWPS